MPSNLPTRLIAPALPLLVIALIAGAAGYMTSDPQPEAIAPLAAEPAGDSGVRGAIQSLTANEILIATDDGQRLTLRLQPDTPVEVLQPITYAEIQPGDWINGGAIPHAQTVLALMGLVLIPDPVLDTP